MNYRNETDDCWKQAAKNLNSDGLARPFQMELKIASE